MTEHSIRVMTMNLRFGLAKDGENRWEKRSPMVAKILDRYPADFIGFQEVNHFQAEFLAQTLKGHGHIGWHNKKVAWWQSNMIFHDASWTCLGQRHHFLSNTPDIPSKIPGSKWPRQCVVGWFQKQDCQILVANTHFDFEEQVQEKSADLVMDFLSSFPSNLPVVIFGDFNSNPGSRAYERFMAHEYSEVFAGKKIVTYHEFEGNDTGRHIDWILFRGNLSLGRHQVIEDQFSGRFPSDHYPIRATLNWEGGS